MKIDILCGWGSVGIRPATIWGDRHRIGVGGAELALLTMCEEWTKHGYEVRLYNDPGPRDEPQLFEQLTVSSFDPKSRRDVLIVFRAPADLDGVTGKHVWWSCDQHAIGDFAAFGRTVDAIVCSSPYHQKYFRGVFGLVDTVTIDLPIRLADYDAVKRVTRNPTQILFSSVPDRGLERMIPIWNRIKDLSPAASLIITSDYRLWGADDPCNREYRRAFENVKRVSFLGAVRRDELIRHQLESALLAYPCVHDELFCISVAEAAVAGSLPVTSSVGALPTTNLGCVVTVPVSEPARFEDSFVESLASLLINQERTEVQRQEVIGRARQRFDPQVVRQQWDERVFNG